MDRPDDMQPARDVLRDAPVHAVSYRFDERPWGLGWRPECSCGWHGPWCDYRSAAEHAGAAHLNGSDGGAP